MPKDRKDRAVSLGRSRASPFPCSSSSLSRLPLSKNTSESKETTNEWEEARCPVCMEHPHNAVLLLCSSHEKGCRPYMCDTSYRHSNCLDQFRKSFTETSSAVSPQRETSLATAQTTHPEAMLTDLQVERSGRESISEQMTSCVNKVKSNLVCPLCRGRINGWMVEESARCFMNSKSRSCACEACDFSGSYMDLRKHARLVHPLVRPSVADPERQRSWRRLERERDLGDLFSTLQPSIGEDGSDEPSLSFYEGGLLTVIFFFRVFEPESSSRSNSRSGTSRARVHVTVRRRPTRSLGESNGSDAASDLRDYDNESSDGGLGPAET